MVSGEHASRYQFRALYPADYDPIFLWTTYFRAVSHQYSAAWSYRVFGMGRLSPQRISQRFQLNIIHIILKTEQFRT